MHDEKGSAKNNTTVPRETAMTIAICFYTKRWFIKCASSQQNGSDVVHKTQHAIH